MKVGHPKAEKMLEKDLLRAVGEHLQEHDFFFWRANNGAIWGKNNGGEMAYRTPSKFSMRGVPDIVMICKGYFVGIELKRVGAAARPEQVAFDKKCHNHGGIYKIIHSVEELKGFLTQMDFYTRDETYAKEPASTEQA